MSKERGIILTADEVRGLRDGSLREIRRPIKPQPEDIPNTCLVWFDGATIWPFHHKNGLAPRCPFGQPGDRLWVRETYAIVDGTGEVEYKADYMYPSSTWRSPATMPRWNSRWTLEIDVVRVEWNATAERWDWVIGVKQVVP